MDASSTEVDAYLAPLPEDQRAALQALRAVIKTAAPEAVESISYGLPTYKYRGKPLIYFGAAKQHCALYGTSEGTVRFQPDAPPSDARVQAFVSERMTAIEAAASRPKARKAPKSGASG